MCYNLGAIPTLDPFADASGVGGAKYQWGQKTPILTQQEASFPPYNTGFPGWTANVTASTNWQDGVKGLNDPCPTGFRIPSATELQGVSNNNTKSPTSTGSGGMWLGPYLFLPISGARFIGNGAIGGTSGLYWTTTLSTNGLFAKAFILYNNSSSFGQLQEEQLNNALSVRCIKE